MGEEEEEGGGDKGDTHDHHDKNVILTPGWIDVHTHISALGRDWEGYTTATQAAAAGGITTIIGMPLNSVPPTTSVDALDQEIYQAHHSKLYVDVGFWGGVVPENCQTKEPLLEELLCSGVMGLKAFLSPLPPEAGFASISPDQLRYAASICAAHQKPLLVHAELMSMQEYQNQIDTAFLAKDKYSYAAHVQSRPAEWEQAAIELICDIVLTTPNCQMHIVHLSNAKSLEIIQKTKKQLLLQSNSGSNSNSQLTVETCPHYLLFHSESIPDGDTRYKCCPPIRDETNQQALWQGLHQGWIDMIASDHSPCEPSMKAGTLQDAWSGISGLQYQLQATWTPAHARGNSIMDVHRWWSRHPAQLATPLNKKGYLAQGQQADFVLWDTAYCGAPNTYSKEYHRWKGMTVYADRETLRGRVLATYVRGVKVYDGIDDVHLEPKGQILLAKRKK